MSAQTDLFAPLGVETAPEKSRPLLEKIQKLFQFIPNLFGVFANSPVMLEGYLGLEGAFEKGSLNAVERSIVLLAASVENSCKYCTAAHSTVLKAFLHVPAEAVTAVRANVPVSDPKLNDRSLSGLPGRETIGPYQDCPAGEALILSRLWLPGSFDRVVWTEPLMRAGTAAAMGVRYGFGTARG